MSMSILYHCFGITGRGYYHVHSRFEGGCTIFRVGQDPSTLECRRCGSRTARRKGTVFRVFKAVPIGMHPVSIEFPVQRVFCLACCMVRQVKIQFADEDRRYTRRFERYALELSRHMTIKGCGPASGGKLVYRKEDPERIPPTEIRPPQASPREAACH